MGKAIFTHADGSIYDDLPEERYHFPRTYLNAVERAVGDWVVYYEPRRVEAGSERTGGRQAYFAVARVMAVEPDRERPDHFYARMADYLAFPETVPFRPSGLHLESLLRKPDGSTNRGAFGRAVRDLPEAEFDAILALGFAGVRAELGAGDWTAPTMPTGGFADPGEAFVHAPRRLVEQVVARPFREAAFARQVKRAYGETCALTGLRILNGGGRPEVQAAHIRPVERDGPDAVRNGLALSGTAHWMFDRGLVSVGDDLSILVARDAVPEAALRLLNPDGRLRAPVEPWMRPHPQFLRFHRERVFKG